MSLREADPTAWLIACEQIRQLASRYAVAMGSHDVDALAELFVPDVRVGQSRTGSDALRQDLTRQLAPLGRTILHVTNHVIDVQDHGHASGVVGTRAELEIGGDWIIQMIQYDDTYEQRGSDWLFVRRVHRLWYGMKSESSPLGLPPANWPENAVGMGNLPSPST
jgi:hypothetical protein